MKGVGGRKDHSRLLSILEASPGQLTAGRVWAWGAGGRAFQSEEIVWRRGDSYRTGQQNHKVEEQTGLAGREPRMPS